MIKTPTSPAGYASGRSGRAPYRGSRSPAIPRNTRKGKSMFNRNCVICEKLITPPDKRRKTCSKQCGEELREQTRVKSDLKRSLGISPPADLVEEAAALRVLTRAIRNA